MKLERMSAEVARRLLLLGQGLLADPAEDVTPALLRQRVLQLGLVQVDSINVVARAHDLTLATRLDGYRPGGLAPLLEGTRELFEHWTHDASVVPSEWFPHWRHRFERDRDRVKTNKWWRSRLGARPEAVAKKLLERIAREGPVGAGDLEASRRDLGEGSWWAWSPQKAALEYLWRTGRVAVTKRVNNFSKVYDLTERVLPAHARLPASSHAEHLEWALLGALDRLGAATPTELSAYFRAVTLAESKRWCAQRVAKGELVEVMVEAEVGAPRRALARPDWRARAEAVPAPPGGARLLSPFDPIVRDRARALRLFGFDYRFEAFTPAPKRRYGYYVLPILDGERLVGRVDLKLDRDANVLRVQGSWWERGAVPARARKRTLEEAVARLARQLGAER